jgi:alanine-glyoxylate transaminase/serine-glyoxylate transaminase/serine-pyruvate transaminase
MQQHKLLMIPGPIEFDTAVLAALGAPTTSHVSPDFIEVFGHSLEMLKEVFVCPDGQPIILAGSGTLAMDSAGANLVGPGDRVLVVNTGYFSDRFAEIAARYGGEVTQVRAPVGSRPSIEEVEAALEAKSYQLVTVTHVDTSTGVLNDVKALADLSHRHGALCLVDGVCSVGAEELRMKDWGVDLVLTASQKALGTPPGLAILVAGPGALAAFRARKTPISSYYADWTNWLPIMEAYEARKSAYFGTPAVNLVWALEVSLRQILKEGLDPRVERHFAISQACKAGLSALGLEQVPLRPEWAAHAMSAPRYPKGINGAEFIAAVARNGVVIAGGLHPAIKAEYVRIGHMGSVDLEDVLATLAAVEKALMECGYKVEQGSAVHAAAMEYQHTARPA